MLRFSEKGKPLVELRLVSGNFSVCKRTPAMLGKAKPPQKTVRRLWAKGAGQFRTRGRYASAAVRGTYWLTADRCDGTLTSVKQGKVEVFDFVKRVRVTVPAGKSYAGRLRAARVGRHGHRGVRRAGGSRALQRAAPRSVLLDGPGGTQVPDEVIEAVASYYRESNANLGGPFETSRRTGGPRRPRACCRGRVPRLRGRRGDLRREHDFAYVRALANRRAHLQDR